MLALLLVGRLSSSPVEERKHELFYTTDFGFPMIGKARAPSISPFCDEIGLGLSLLSF